MEQAQQARAAAQTVKENLDKLLNLTKHALKQVDPEQMKEAGAVHNDISKIQKAVKKGDINELQNIANKYAGKNSK